MQWRNKLKPVHGDQRTITRFVFWPKCLPEEIEGPIVSDGMLWKWLEFAEIAQVYEHRYTIDGQAAWWDLHWLKKNFRSAE